MKKKKYGIKRIMVAVLFFIGIVILTVVLITAGINFYMVNTTENDIVTVDEAKQLEPDCIVVLGAMVRSDGSPSLILQERLDTAIDLYQSGISDKILMSGDNGQNEYNEVIPMRRYAIDHGIPAEDIYLDYAGFSTYESMYRLRDIFQVERAVVVTQTYHLHRALYIGKKLGLDVKGFAAADRPSGQLKRNIREVFARVKSFGLVMTNAEPTFLGDLVPLDKPQQITE